MRVELKAKKVVSVKRSVEIEGEEFDFHELLGLLCEIRWGIKIMEPMATQLKKLGVIDSAGSRYSGASKGPRFDEIHTLITELECDPQWDELRTAALENTTSDEAHCEIERN